ncbi:glycosyltransferase family 4 protein [Candidatus Marsarchaeota archaeon]|nr:glycosyltransferase family 4 protein [Candidatus Marsarchaeota archaeon]
MELFYGRSEFITGLLAKAHVDAAHFDSPEILNVYAEALHNSHIPIVWEVHNIHSDLLQQLGYNRKRILAIANRERTAANACDAVLCRSSSDANKLINISGISRHKVFIYNGCIDTKPLEKLRPAPSSMRIVTFGNFYYEPNKRMLVNLVSIMREMEKVEKDIMLDVIGDIPPALRRKVESTNIKVHGFIPDLANAIRRNSILVAPIDSGSGTRVKLLVAMASGMPVITTTKGAEGLDLRGSVIISDDLTEYPKLIMYLLHNKRLYACLSAKGRKLVQKEYDWFGQIDQVISAYRFVATPKPTSGA